jgi:hypothetical protein
VFFGPNVEVIARYIDLADIKSIVPLKISVPEWYHEKKDLHYIGPAGIKYGDQCTLVNTLIFPKKQRFMSMWNCNTYHLTPQLHLQSPLQLQHWQNLLL